MKLRTARIRSPSRRAREAEDMADDESVRGGPRTRTCGRTQRSSSPIRGAPTHVRGRPRGRTVVASRTTDRELIPADLDDASDASINPRVVAAAPGAPSLVDMFDIEDQGRVEHAVKELERLDTVEANGVSDNIHPIPRMLPISTQVHIRTEDRFNRYVYDAFVVCGATTRVAAFLSREVVTMKGLAELVHGGGRNVEKWITGVAKRLNTGESTVITPVLTQRVRNLTIFVSNLVCEMALLFLKAKSNASLMIGCFRRCSWCSAGTIRRWV